MDEREDCVQLKFGHGCKWLRPSAATLGFNPLNAELNPICHLLALVRAHHILHVSRVRVKDRKIKVTFCHQERAINHTDPFFSCKSLRLPVFPLFDLYFFRLLQCIHTLTWRYAKSVIEITPFNSLILKTNSLLFEKVLPSPVAVSWCPLSTLPSPVAVSWCPLSTLSAPSS